MRISKTTTRIKAGLVIAMLLLQVAGDSYGPPRWWGRRDIRVDQYSEGTLTVDLIDPNSNQLIWRGRVSGTVELKNLDKKVDKAVAKLVKQLAKDSTRKA